MHRISYDGEFGGELRWSVINALNHEIQEMGKQLGFVRQEIYEIVVVGNSTMRDIFFKLDVQKYRSEALFNRQSNINIVAVNAKLLRLLRRHGGLGFEPSPKRGCTVCR